MGKLMLDWNDFDKRAKALFKSQQTMALPRYWKSGKRKGQVRVPGVDLPFDAEDFRRWLAREIGLNAKQCPYCGVPIDITTCVPDHKTPRALGGSFGLENLHLIDKECNERKGKLSHQGFIDLLAFCRAQLPPHDTTVILQRLRASGHGFNKFRGGTKKPAQDVFELPPF